ncbi:MAG: MerR family transcriptional regulator [Roseateles depolymerans]|uniref:MerR family transcriptional regulator n=1 Tax=Roseateles depolymerans TaxID=76731 RepID=A0A2W5DEN2_9BURK|nr:MAG: MerR family transcriptional regulator [Roseateles depolymerans]
MSDHTVPAEVLDESVEFTLVEFCRASRTAVEEVQVWVVEGVLKPQGTGPDDWRFAAGALRRARLARTLVQELDVNVPGVALALDLMDQIETLKASLRRAGLEG